MKIIKNILCYSLINSLLMATFSIVAVDTNTGEVGSAGGSCIAGSIIIEIIFSVPGVGKLLIESVEARDEIMVQGVVTFIAVVYIAVNLIVDLLYAVLDPRIARGT